MSNILAQSEKLLVVKGLSRDFGKGINKARHIRPRGSARHLRLDTSTKCLKLFYSSTQPILG